MVIYIDILLILNLFVDYFLLLSSSVLLSRKVKRRRLIFGAFVGSLSSLLIFLPNLYILLTLLIKVITGFIVVLVTFGYNQKAIFIKTVLVFLGVNLIFIGLMFGLWMFVSPAGMLWKNGVTYIAISPVILIFGSVVAYFCTVIINFILSRRIDGDKIYTIKVSFNGKSINVKALHDTGNCLTDPFSGKPVFICEYDAISSILPDKLTAFFCDSTCHINDIKDSDFFEDIRIIPCNTITGSSILPAFLPQSVTIIKEGSKHLYNCYIAVTTKKISDGEYHAIIGDFK